MNTAVCESQFIFKDKFTYLGTKIKYEDRVKDSIHGKGIQAQKIISEFQKEKALQIHKQLQVGDVWRNKINVK